MCKLILEFICIWKGSKIVKIILKKKNKTEEIMLLNFKNYCKATFIRAVYIMKDRQVEGNGESRIRYGPLILANGTNSVDKDRILNKCARTIGYPHLKVISVPTSHHMQKLTPKGYLTVYVSKNLKLSNF